MKLKGSTLFIVALTIFLFFVPLGWALGWSVSLSPFYMNIFQWAMIWVIMSCSYRLLTMVGQLSLAHGAWMAVGGYTSAILTVDYGWNPWAAWPIGVLVVALLSAPVGIICLKVRGLYLLIMTMGVAQVVGAVILGFPELTHGAFGIAHIPAPPDIGNITFLGMAGRPAFFYLTLIVMLICLLVMSRMESGRLIRITEAGIRQNDLLAKSVGIKIARYKVMAFVVSAMFASICGSIGVHYYNYIRPETYLEGLTMIVYCIGGGREVFVGPIIGAMVFSSLPEFLRMAKAYQPMIFGGTLILVITVLPGGLVSIPARLRRRFGKKEVYVPPAWV